MPKSHGLTPKESRFIQEYLLDLNAAHAAIRAGYSEHTAKEIGYQILKKEAVQEAVTKAITQRSKRTQITQDKVLKELARIAFSDMDDFALVEDGKLTLIDSTARKSGRSKVIKKITQSESQSSGVEGSSSSMSQGLELHDKLKALELLGKHLKMFKDTIDIQGKMTLADLVAGSKDDGDEE